jgi:hypothetical protein
MLGKLTKNERNGHLLQEGKKMAAVFGRKTI